MQIQPTVTLLCTGCGRTFEKSSSAFQKHRLVACPHCATLQAGRLANEAAPSPLAGTVKPTYRKGA